MNKWTEQEFKNRWKLVVIKLPYLKSTILCDKLAKGMGHNSYVLCLGKLPGPKILVYIRSNKGLCIH